jgi:tetratricopeptide (TPR) repeat protein
MPGHALRTALLVVVAAAFLGLAAGLQWAREQRYPAAAATEESLYLTSGAAVQRLTRGYNALAADLYWIRAIQHYGGVKLRLANSPRPGRPGGEVPSEYQLLYPLLDITTTLDPRFNIAYRFGAIFLAEPYPGGAGRPDLAIALLEKGLRERPDKWEYMQDIGFVHYWWRHDYPEAARWFDRAAQVSGAPWWLKSLSAVTLAEGGDRRSSRLMWEAILQSAEIEWLRNDAERRLLQLRALDQIDELQRAVEGFTAAAGSPPADWAALVQARVLPGVPLDPGGTPYEIADGRVRMARSSALFPLPDEPKSLFPPR